MSGASGGIGSVGGAGGSMMGGFDWQGLLKKMQGGGGQPQAPHGVRPSQGVRPVPPTGGSNQGSPFPQGDFQTNNPTSPPQQGNPFGGGINPFSLQSGQPFDLQQLLQQLPQMLKGLR